MRHTNYIYCGLAWSCYYSGNFDNAMLPRIHLSVINYDPFDKYYDIGLSFHHRLYHQVFRIQKYNLYS